MPLGADETTECFNNFLFPKHNGTVGLYINLARLNQVLIRPVYYSLTM